MTEIQAIGIRSGSVFVEFFEALPDRFTTRDVLDVARELDFSQPTAHQWLRKLQEHGFILRVRHGEYVKLSEDENVG